MEVQSAQKTQVIIKKGCERDIDEKICAKWREARAHFFVDRIMPTINQKNVQSKHRVEIVQLFSNSQNIIDFQNLGTLKKYYSQIKELRQQLKESEQLFARKERQCIPLLQLIQSKFSSLKTIKIQYRLLLKHGKYQCRYSVSAFGLFKMVHQNKQLSQLTLQGIWVQQFQQFIRYINVFNKVAYSKNQRWMNNFVPSNTLKLSISAQIHFFVSRYQQTVCQINDMQFFSKKFHEMSNITAKIPLGQWIDINMWDSTLQNVWRCLTGIKKIGIQVEGSSFSCIGFYSILSIRTSLFGGLSSFTEIDRLSLKNINFGFDLNPNYLLAISQILTTIFLNNRISHLELQMCTQFPIFHEITDLHLISMQKVTFKQKFNLMGKIIKSNQSLRSIKCFGLYIQERISEELFNQLSVLSIQRFQDSTLADISSSSPSSMKHLAIEKAETGRVNNLPVIFSKLHSLTQLCLKSVQFEDRLLCQIPSIFLQSLTIWQNDQITNKGIQEIDSKWRNLRYLQLKKCMKISAQVWNNCEFKELRVLKVDIRMMGQGRKGLYDWKKRGVEVHY